MANNQIALLAKVPEFETPLESQGKALQIRSLMNQGENQNMEMQQKRAAIERTNSLRTLMSTFKPETNTDEQVSALTRAGHLTEARSVAESAAKVNKDKRDAEKAEMEGHFKKFEMAGQIMGGVKDQATWDIARQQTAQVFGPEAAAQMPAQYDPQLVEQKRAQAMSVKEQLEQVWKQKGYDREMASDAETLRHNKSTEGITIRGQNLTDARAKEAAQGADTQFTPEAITNAAARYNIDGTLPPMGMGKTGSAGRAAILNEAARQKAGVDPSQQRRDQLNAKGEAQANAASMRAYSASGKEGQAIQAANTGLNHLETVEQMALAQKNGNIQLFNKLANRFAAETGNPAPTNMAAAITMVSPEVSKAVIGAAGGQHEREEFARNFNPNASPQQTLQGIGVIKELMGGRLTEAQRTYERTVKRKDFRESMLSPAAQRVLDKAHGNSDSAGGSGKDSSTKPSLDDIFGK